MDAIIDENKKSWLQRFILWREKKIKEKHFILILSFLAGIFTALAAWFLKFLVEWIKEFLTENFDSTGVNWLYLVYPVFGIFLTGLFIRYIVKDDISHGVTKILYAISRRQSRIKRHNTWSSVIASAIRLRTIADNWLNPPALRVGGGTFEGYDAVQKAYLLRPARGAHRCVVQLSEAGEQGVVNPVFILKGAASGAAEVCVNGRPVPRGEYEAAPVEHDYEAATLVWLGRTVQEGDRVEITIQ